MGSLGFDTCAMGVMGNLNTGDGQVFHLCPDQYQHDRGLDPTEAGGARNREHLNKLWSDFEAENKGASYCVVRGPQAPEKRENSSVLPLSRRFTFEVASFTEVMYDPAARTLTLYDS